MATVDDLKTLMKTALDNIQEAARADLDAIQTAFLGKKGKVIPYGSANSSHIMSKKDAKRRRRLRNPTPVKGAQASSMRTYMGK